MSDSSQPQPADDHSQTTLYRRAADGGLQVAPPQSGDWREGLRSGRWNAAPLENPEVEKTDPRIAVAAILALGLLTLVLLVVGYGVVGLWNLPA
jgi:hypothetical protein